MSLVHLEILEPQHQARFAGTGTVRLHGRVVSQGHRPLFFKWYSSLHAPSDATKVALNGPTDNALDVVTSLAVGSHILTFTAKDVEGDSPDELKKVQDAGMAGGPLDAESPCIIHIFIANLVRPASDGATLNKANSVLEAVAPMKWGDPDYQSINHIRYRWRFEPLGPPAGRRSADLMPRVEELTFDPSGPLVRYQGPLPDGLDTGDYTLTLRVEGIKDNTVGDEDSKPVKIQTPVV